MFIRFGKLPPGGRSKNFISGQLEAGVSVYRAVMHGGEWMADLTGVHSPFTFMTLSGPVYLVDGTIVGTGSDGEPVLRDVRIIQRLAHVRPFVREPDFTVSGDLLIRRDGLDSDIHQTYWLVPDGDGYLISSEPSSVYARWGRIGLNHGWKLSVVLRFPDGSHCRCSCPSCSGEH